jgi:site-specific DNA-cytosine methylase
MRVLIACEFSGIVREAFKARGHDAWSCDLLPTEIPGKHIEGDAIDAANSGPWDLMVAHPPCTYLTRAGARWWKGRESEQDAAVEFVRKLMAAPIPMICIENPPGALTKRIRPPDQYIHPWEHGHPERKMTGLWLSGLPLLIPTRDVSAEMAALPVKDRNRVHYAAPGPDRWKERSRTLPGIAVSMADQWGCS